MLFVLAALTASNALRPYIPPRRVLVQYRYPLNEDEEYFNEYQFDDLEANKGRIKKLAKKTEKAADVVERGIKVAKTARKIYKFGKRLFNEAEENSFDQPIEYQYYENDYDDEDDLNDFYLSQLAEVESNKGKAKKIAKGAKKAAKAAKTAYKIYKFGKKFF